MNICLFDNGNQNYAKKVRFIMYCTVLTLIMALG
jgi:hypothetical protein